MDSLFLKYTVMITGQDKKKGGSFTGRLKNKIKYGLVLDSIRNQIARIGIKIVPYYWVQEGINPIVCLR